MSAALFHEHCAAELGIKEAIVTLASIHLGLPHELLVNVYLEVSILSWHGTSFCLIMQVFNLIVAHEITKLDIVTMSAALKSVGVNFSYGTLTKLK